MRAPHAHEHSLVATAGGKPELRRSSLLLADSLLLCGICGGRGLKAWCGAYARGVSLIPKQKQRERLARYRIMCARGRHSTRGRRTASYVPTGILKTRITASVTAPCKKTRRVFERTLTDLLCCVVLRSTFFGRMVRPISALRRMKTPYRWRKSLCTKVLWRVEQPWGVCGVDRGIQRGADTKVHTRTRGR